MAMVRPSLYFFRRSIRRPHRRVKATPTRSARLHLLPNAPATADAIVYLIVVYSNYGGQLMPKAKPPTISHF
jgi:hypothetical protein